MNLIEKAKESADAMATASTRIAYTGSGTAIVSGLTLEKWGIIIGIVIGVFTAVTNFYFRKLEHKARMKRLEMGRRSDTDMDQLP